MIWMIQGDGMAADGMVMFSLSILHIQYNEVCITKSNIYGTFFQLHLWAMMRNI